jgi:hypothetical protein
MGSTAGLRYVAIGASGSDGLDDICALLRVLSRPRACVQTLHPDCGGLLLDPPHRVALNACGYVCRALAEHMIDGMASSLRSRAGSNACGAPSRSTAACALPSRPPEAIAPAPR